jgi:hypothetical protein
MVSDRRVLSKKGGFTIFLMRVLFLCGGMMKFFMTSGAKSYKIFLAVVTQLAPKSNMVHLQFARSSTILAPPIISFHDLATEPNVAITLQPDSRLFRLRAIHADSFRLLINSSF